MQRNPVPRSAPWFTVLAAAALVAACAGDADGDAGATNAATTDKTPPVAMAEAALVDDEGHAMPPLAAAVPQDPAARTRAGRYATAAQAAAFEQAMGERVLHADLGCCGAEALELAVGLAHAEQAAKDLPNAAPVLVRGADLRLAAATAERLAAAGHANVWVVTR